MIWRPKFLHDAVSLYCHYGDVIMSLIASQITSLAIVYSTVYSGADQRKHQSSASLAFVRGIHRGPVNSPHKWPVTGKMFPFDDVIMWVNRFRTNACFSTIVDTPDCSHCSDHHFRPFSLQLPLPKHFWNIDTLKFHRTKSIIWSNNIPCTAVMALIEFFWGSQQITLGAFI